MTNEITKAYLKRTLFNVNIATQALENPDMLFGAFVWIKTHEGVWFWSQELRSRTLSPEARVILERMITAAHSAPAEDSLDDSDSPSAS